MFPSGSMMAANARNRGFRQGYLRPQICSLLKGSLNVRDVYIVHPWLSWILPFHDRTIDSGTICARVSHSQASWNGAIAGCVLNPPAISRDMEAARRLRQLPLAGTSDTSHPGDSTPAATARPLPAR